MILGCNTRKLPQSLVLRRAVKLDDVLKCDNRLQSITYDRNNITFIFVVWYDVVMYGNAVMLGNMLITPSETWARLVIIDND